jgi:hypothetical protein
MHGKAKARVRPGLILGLVLLSPCAAPSQQSPDVQVYLSIQDGKDSFRAGEPIVLVLTFTAKTPGYQFNEITTEPASPVDRILLSPTGGVYPWLDDYSRERRYTPDYETANELQPGQPLAIELPLNGVYRFDEPGHYAVRVTTARVSRASSPDPSLPGALTSNEASFDIVPMDAADEAATAQHLESLIRSAPEVRTAQRYARELRWLSGDPSTRVKLSLFLHPKEFYPFGVDVTDGLWVARNRALVVSTLEQAMRDPQQPMEPVGSLLRTAVALKARVESPFNSGSSTNPLPQAKQIEREYIRRIAATLPLRQGENLVGAAITVLTSLVQREEISTTEFEAAREALISHFADVDEYELDWVLNAYGKYLQDGRMIPVLESMFEKAKFESTRDAIQNQLTLLRDKN